MLISLFEKQLKEVLHGKDNISYHYEWGSHLFLADIKNVRIDQEYKDMDLEKIDLLRLKPAIYATVSILFHRK